MFYARIVMNLLLTTLLLNITAQVVTNTPASLLPHGKRIYTQNQNLNQLEWDASLLSVGGPPINTSQSYLAKADEKMANPPLTIKARVKTANLSAFNIFVAYEPKSGAHWELYSYAKSGVLSFYVPGNRPAEIRSTALVADNQWHDVQVNWTLEKIVLLMDGKPVAEAPYNRPAVTASNPKIGVGRLVEGTLRCDGQVLNVEVNGSQLESLKISEPEAPSALFPSEGQNLYTPGVKPPKNIPVVSYTLNSLPSFQLETVKPEIFRPGVIYFWSEYVKELEDQISGAMPLPRGAADQVYDKQSLIQPGEKTAFDVILRRTQLLIDFAKAHPDAEKWQRDLNRIKAAGKPEDVFALCALRRVVMLADPALSTYNSMVFVGRATYAGSRLTSKTNTDRTGGHFATQCFGFNTIAGGGLFMLDSFTAAQPRVRNLLDGAIVQNGKYQGKPITEGSFWSPEVSYDGKTVYFAHCASKQHVWQWTEDSTWKIFKLDIASKKIWQLTEGPWNDFDPTELPSGRIVFVSERRGAFIRCFTESSRHRVPTFVLHSMKNDGRDIYPLSYYETSEWHPSVDNNGMLVYTRWDYTDREDCLGSLFWIAYPDGRDPRAPHGNYPFPWHTFEDNTHGDHRFGRCKDAPSALPMSEMHTRSLPNSSQYVTTLSVHHGESFGTLGILDLRLKDDYHFSQLRRVTPYAPLPESENAGRQHYKYGTAWPVTDDLFICNRWEDLVLVDKYGNEELVCEREILPLDGYDPRLRLTHPKPLRARPKPPIIPQRTAQGEDFRDADQRATIGIINVNVTDQPFPKDRKPTRLRVLQVIPKHDPWMDKPFIGYGKENTPRVVLGTTPIETDGSAYFEAPAGRLLIFQVVDENNAVIQTMRSAAFVHPGERLTCIGCHESKQEANPSTRIQPIAFQREAKKLEAECGIQGPISYNLQIKPIMEQRCVGCHLKEKKGPQDMSYEGLRPYAHWFGGGFCGSTMQKIYGGSRSIPGRCGAFQSRIGKAMLSPAHQARTKPEDRHAIILWLDANALRYTAFHDLEKQEKGALVWPLLDTDPSNVLKNLD
jgi:hypothetical protein